MHARKWQLRRAKNISIESYAVFTVTADIFKSKKALNNDLDTTLRKSGCIF